MSITKSELVKNISRMKKNSNDPISNFGKEFNLFLFVLFSFSTILGMIFLICIFYHLWYYHFDAIIIFPFVLINILPT